MFISKSLVFVTALLLGSVIAAPLRERDFDSEVDLEAREPTTGHTPKHSFKEAAHAVKTINKIEKHLHPAKHEATFWSGQYKHKDTGKPTSVYNVAQKFAHKHGKSSLEQGLRKNKILIPPKSKNRYSYNIWGKASKVWAQRASGSTHAVLGGSVRPQSVYKQIEKPALMKNKKVTALFEHNKDTGKVHVAKRPARSFTMSSAAKGHGPRAPKRSKTM